MAVRFLAVAALLAGLAIASARAEDRLVHRFLAVVPSPDGTLVAAIEGDGPPSGYEPQIRALTIRHADADAAVTVALPCGAVAGCWPASPVWSPDGRHLVFALRTPGTHERSLYSVAPDGSGLTRLLAFAGTLDHLTYGPNGKLALLAIEGATKEPGATQAGAPITGDLDERVREQRIALLDGDHLDWVSPPDLFVYEYDWMPDGHGFVGTAAPGDGDNNWWIAKLYGFDAAGGAAKLIYQPSSIRQQIAEPKVARDGKRIAFIGGIMSDFGSTGGDVFTVPIGSGTALDVTPGMPASASSIAWNCDGRLVAQLLADDKTEIAELGDGKAAAAPHVTATTAETIGGNLGGTAYGCASKIIATTHESFTVPPEIEIGSPGSAHDLTHANTGLTMPLTAQSLDWQSDGATAQGWLLLPLPAPAGKLALITQVHGGPAAANRPRFAGPGLTRTLLEHGYALFQPNPRGSFGQGEVFTAANVRDLGHGDLKDILAGIDAVERKAPIDEARLAIMGGSYGGFMTMWAVTQTHRFKAAVAVAGISDWLSYYGENGIDEWMMPYYGATVYDDPAAYARSSPIDFIRNVTTPTLEYVGENDIECPPPQTQEFWHALHTLGVPTQSVIYPGEGHGLRKPENLADSEKRVLAWYAKYLK